MATSTCWSCGQTYDPPDLITRESECPECAAFLRCCRNCEFFDASAHNSCRETQAELQGDKDVANACDYFRAASSVTPANSRKKGKRDFDSLFED